MANNTKHVINTPTLAQRLHADKRLELKKGAVMRALSQLYITQNSSGVAELHDAYRRNFQGVNTNVTSNDLDAYVTTMFSRAAERLDELIATEGSVAIGISSEDLPKMSVQQFYITGLAQSRAASDN